MEIRLGRRAGEPRDEGPERADPPDQPDWARSLGDALLDAPEPEHAARLASDVLAELPTEERDALGRDHPEELTRILFGCCGVAPFLANPLRRHPDWIGGLLRSDLSQPRQRATLESIVAAALAECADEEAEVEAALRRVKYFELARLTVRDTSETWVPIAGSGVTLTELSQLADALLDAALGVARRRVAARSGAPRWTGADGGEVELGFCVLALGKLGSEELNFSSDVDLVYIHDSVPDGIRTPADGLDPVSWFTRLAREFGRIAEASTADGFLYRVDLELRPEGTRGPLVGSNEALAHYYEVSADTWEKAAFMKARPVAGDLELGWRTIRAVSPMIYRSSMDFAGVQGVRALKDKVEEARGGSDAGFNVKIDSGGIRDLEFIAQAMQLLHGGRIPQLRGRSTRAALGGLAEVGLLPGTVTEELLDAYLFLRRLENRIQMEAERQTQIVPADDAARRRLARAMGYLGDDGLAEFDASLDECRERVRSRFTSFFPESRRDRILDLFARNTPQLLGLSATRAMLEDLAEQFALAIEATPEPESALNNFDRFLAGIGGRQFYYELLLDRPELVPRLSALFGASRFLSDILARHPRLIEPVFDNPETLLLSRDQLRDDLRAIRTATNAEDPDATEERLDAMRLFHNRQVVNIGLLDVAQKIDRDQVEHALSDVAEICLEEALDVANAASARRRADLPPAARDTRFLVIGMGKLGSREMGYGSDLDLIFLYDLGEAEDPDAPGAVAAAQDFTVRLAQRLISAIQTRTAEGACYEIDARMRPSGQQGSLVTSLPSFERYHAGEAAIWERQALLRARGVAGDAGIGEAFMALRRQILERPLTESPREEIHRIRLRMETELAQETRLRHDFKTGRGGVLDVESVVQVLRLENGARHPELFEPTNMTSQLGHLERFELLDPDSLRTLREGWEFLRRLGSRLRMVENRSISDLDEERGDLDALARSLGYRAPSRESGARRALLRDYRHHTEAIRAVYLSVMGDGAA